MIDCERLIEHEVQTRPVPPMVSGVMVLSRWHHLHLKSARGSRIIPRSHDEELTGASDEIDCACTFSS
jgi:hypothetical protein